MSMYTLELTVIYRFVVPHPSVAQYLTLGKRPQILRHVWLCLGNTS